MRSRASAMSDLPIKRPIHTCVLSGILHAMRIATRSDGRKKGVRLRRFITSAIIDVLTAQRAIANCWAPSSGIPISSSIHPTVGLTESSSWLIQPWLQVEQTHFTFICGLESSFDALLPIECLIGMLTFCSVQFGHKCSRVLALLSQNMHCFIEVR